jgi:hypothetical protein
MSVQSLPGVAGSPDLSLSCRLMRSRDTLGDSPWRVRDVTSAGGRLGVAVAVIVASWVGASGTVLWEDQLLWTALSVGAVAFGLSGVAGWLLAGFRGIRYETEAVLTPLRHLEARRVARTPQSSSARTVTCRGMAHYHRADCLLVAGKASARTTPRHAKLLPCGVCSP